MYGECFEHDIQWSSGGTECPVCKLTAERDALREAIKKARTTPEFIYDGKGLWDEYTSTQRAFAFTGAMAVLDAIDAILAAALGGVE